jgi:hypothetical protein
MTQAGGRWKLTLTSYFGNAAASWGCQRKEIARIEQDSEQAVERQIADEKQEFLNALRAKPKT